MAGCLNFLFCVTLFHPRNTMFVVVQFLAFSVQMAKTHLEHQPVKYRFRPNQNGTTTYSPYSNYDPRQGLTTATILGTGFLLIIIYIVLKVTWPKVQKRCCGNRLTESRVLDVETQLIGGKSAQLANNIRHQRVPIMLTADSETGNSGKVSKVRVNMSPLNPDPPSFNRSAANDILTEKFTMIISKNPNPLTKPRTKHQTLNHNSQLDCGDIDTNLPPLVDQVLRTAHWVNSVHSHSLERVDDELTPIENAEPSSACNQTAAVSDVRIGADPLIIKAEINHRKQDYGKCEKSLDNNNIEREAISTTQV